MRSRRLRNVALATGILVHAATTARAQLKGLYVLPIYRVGAVKQSSRRRRAGLWRGADVPPTTLLGAHLCGLVGSD